MMNLVSFLSHSVVCKHVRLKFLFFCLREILYRQAVMSYYVCYKISQEPCVLVALRLLYTNEYVNQNVSRQFSKYFGLFLESSLIIPKHCRKVTEKKLIIFLKLFPS